MKKIVLILTLVALMGGGCCVQAQQSKKGKSPKVEGCQKVRQSDFLTYDRFTNFSTKDVNRYYVDYDYSQIPSVVRQSSPQWAELQPVVNYIQKVSRAPLTICAIYAVNPEQTDRDERARLLRQAEDEASAALNAFDKWKVNQGWRNKMQYHYAEVDYRYFKGAAYNPDENSSDIIHVGLIIYFGSKKRPIFDIDSSSRTFPDIKFFPNDATIVESWYTTLDELSNYLKENDRKTVLLSGYADNSGTEAYAVGLSRQRAVEIKKALQMRGVDATRIEVEAHGSENPIGDNNTYEGRVMNNRVAIKIQ